MAKSYAEQVADLEATRKEKADRMKAIQEKATEQSRTLDSAEQEDFDTLKNERETIGKSIANLRDLEAMEKAEKADAATAKAVDDSANRKSTVSTGRVAVEVKSTESAV